MKKLLAVGVIVLFLGLAIAPSINANVSKASIDSELVEITTEVCGLNGGKHAVSLSKEDAEEVEQLIDDIERRLDEVETREETVEIFNEAVVELDKYGLLGGLSVEQAQKLVTGGYQNERVMKLLERLYTRNQDDDSSNYFCLVAGETNNTIVMGNFLICWSIILFSFPYIAYICSNLFPDLYEALILSGLLVLLYGALILSGLLPFGLSFYSPLALRNFIFLGVYGENCTYPAQGWIHTIGLKGIKKFDGKFLGKIHNLPVFQLLFKLAESEAEPLVGVSSFSGIKINKGIDDELFFYIGFALWVKIEEFD